MTKHPRMFQNQAASTAAALRASTVLSDEARTPPATSLTAADVDAMIRDGRIEYSDANKKKVRGAIGRCKNLYNAPLDQISADLGHFREKWGKGPVRSYPVGKFHDTKAFCAWRSNVAGAFARAAALTAAAAQAPAPEIAAAWDAYLDAISAATGSKRKGAVFERQAFSSYRRVAEIGRAAGVLPTDMTTEIFTAARDAAVTEKAKGVIGLVARRHDNLRELPEFRHLAPKAPVAPLPSRRRARTDSVARLRTSVRGEWETWLAARPLECAPLTGEIIPLSKGLMGQYHAAFGWYVDWIARLDLVDLSSLDSLQTLCRTDWLKRVVQASIKDNGPGPNKDSIGKYCRKLAHLFLEYGVEVRNDKNLKQSTGMAKRREEWCKALIRSPRLQEVFFHAPKLLRRRAEAALKNGRTNEAIRAGAIAVSQSLLIYVAPLRAGNTVDLSLTGADATLHLERGIEAGLLLVPGDRTKNGQPVEAPFPDEHGPYAPRGMIDWFRQRIRPLMLERAGVEHSAWLFPGKSLEGTISYASYLNWFKGEMAAIGLPMTPHQTRHAVASLMLDEDPSALPDIAAYLGDTVKTVLEYYIFIDRLKKHMDAQKRVLDGLKRFDHRSRRSEDRA